MEMEMEMERKWDNGYGAMRSNESSRLLLDPCSAWLSSQDIAEGQAIPDQNAGHADCK